MHIRSFEGQGLFDVDLDAIMNGQETYPVVGDLIDQRTADKCMSKMQGFLLYGDCLRKNALAAWLLGYDRLHVGSLLVYGIDEKPVDGKVGLMSYGFEYDPPLEYHAWVQTPAGGVIDLALPGVILRAKRHSDDRGPMLPLVRPVILAERPHAWLKYKSYDTAALSVALRA